jgi:hypothetical protein
MAVVTAFASDRSRCSIHRSDLAATAPTGRGEHSNERSGRPSYVRPLSAKDQSPAPTAAWHSPLSGVAPERLVRVRILVPRQLIFLTFLRFQKQSVREQRDVPYSFHGCELYFHSKRSADLTWMRSV